VSQPKLCVHVRKSFLVDHELPKRSVLEHKSLTILWVVEQVLVVVSVWATGKRC